jgi:hypothetical protein
LRVGEVRLHKALAYVHRSRFVVAHTAAFWLSPQPRDSYKTSG